MTVDSAGRPALSSHLASFIFLVIVTFVAVAVGVAVGEVRGWGKAAFFGLAGAALVIGGLRMGFLREALRWMGEVQRSSRALLEAEEEIQRLNETLEARVTERTRDLVASQAQLRQAQKMEAIGRLAGGIAHDFNNLLTAMMGYGQELAGRLTGQDREDLDEIMKAAERAASLTRQLLAFSRRQMLQPSVLEVNQVLSDLEKMLRRIIGEDVELVTRFTPDGVGRVRADRGQLEQLVMNLAVNARDAMPEGGRLTLETSAVQLEVAAARSSGVAPGRYVRIAVADTGTGMTEEVKSHLFEPFFTTKEQGKGTGLGLATAYGIVKQSGGGITVESAPGRGSVFSVFLPMVEEPAEARDTPLFHPPLVGTETLLVVEDEDGVRKLVGAVLRKQGYSVMEAAGGEEALRLLSIHHGPLDLLLTDIVMPGMSGYELAEQVKRLRPSIRVAFMSGYTDPDRFKTWDHQLLILKPFTPDDLSKKIRSVLSER